MAAVRLAVLIVPPPAPFGMWKSSAPLSSTSSRDSELKLKTEFCPTRTTVPSGYWISARESDSLSRKFCARMMSCGAAGRFTLRSDWRSPRNTLCSTLVTVADANGAAKPERAIA